MTTATKTKMSLGDRMKRYEQVTSFCLSRRTPVIIRVDGRAFHTYTKGLARPFDGTLINAMVKAATAVAEDMQGFKAAYIQSDEASFLLTDWETHDTESWFDYTLQKVCSIAASVMTAHFNRAMAREKIAYFDARAFNVPREEVVNLFLWRAQDWGRNSIQMYARSFFSQKELHGKRTPDMHDMLHGIGKNWATDLSPQLKNGTFLFAPENAGDDPARQTKMGASIRVVTTVQPKYEEIAAYIDPLLKGQEEDDD